MLPSALQGLATRWLANLPERDNLPLDYTTLPGRTSVMSPEFRPFSVEIPNEEPLKTFSDSDSGRGLVESKSAKDMFRKLGI